MPKVASASLVGRVIDGRYRVLSHLADGGMGSVFVAVDDRLDREVALKVMRPDLARDDAFVARFRREARSAARLSHPHVVSVYDQGQDDHYVFLAMELVRGRTLRDAIRSDAPMTPRAALEIVDPMLQALAAAHRAGLVHRDVKPENVLIGDDGVVKVADFGLARAVTTETVTSNSDVLLGTAAYLAPEQVEHGRADKRSDVYSAGLLLFEALTGEKAFPGDSPIHVAYQHVHGDLPVPSDAVPSIAPVIDGLVALASARQPEDRPVDAADLLVELRRVRATLSDEQLDARPPAADPVSAHPGSRTTSQSPSSTAAFGHRSTTALHRTPGDGAPSDPQRRGPRPGGAARSSGGDGSHARPPAGLGIAREPRHRHTPWWVAGALAVLLLLGGGWWFTAGPGGSASVPDVAGQTQGQAVQAVHAAGLAVNVDETFSETVRKGAVIASSPAAGADRRKSDPVVLNVSKGPERYAVPQVVNRTEAQARQAVSGAHLSVGAVTQQYSETVPSGKVLSVSPATGSQQKKGAKVTLVVSKGRQPITVPDVTDTDQATAEATLSGLGLTTTTAADAYSDSVPQGSVISQAPSTGTLYRGDTVTLTISKGPEMVTVPNVIDLNTSQAKAKLEAAGFQVKVSRFFGGLLDTVRGQDPHAGKQVRKGSTVTISVV